MDTKLTPKQSRTLVAVVASRSVNEGLHAAGTAKSTWHTWMQNPAFAERYRQAQRQIVEHANEVLLSALTDAATTLRSLLGSDSCHVQLRAAIAILEQYHQRTELSDLTARLDRLEAHLRLR